MPLPRILADVLKARPIDLAVGTAVMGFDPAAPAHIDPSRRAGTTSPWPQNRGWARIAWPIQASGGAARCGDRTISC